MALSTTNPVTDRATLALVFGKYPALLRAIEALQKTAMTDTPPAVNDAQDTATASGVRADAAQVTADTAIAAINAIKAAQFVVLALSGTLTGERVLVGATGVSLDVGTPDQVKIVVDALAILNSAAITLTQAVDVQAALRCDSLQVDQTPAATVTASDHSIPINCNGVTYYMRLSTAP